MPEFSGRLIAHGPVAIVVSRYNELITGRLLEGARAACGEAGVAVEQVDVIWVEGAFELPAVAAAAAATGRYTCIVGIGAVIRGDMPHFEYVAGEAARGLNAVAVEHRIPVAFGVLTVDTMEQAQARAGGDAGNKGHEAASAAIAAADVIVQLRAAAAAGAGVALHA